MRLLFKLAWLPLLSLTAPAAVLNLNTGAVGSGWTVMQTAGISNNGAALNTSTTAVVLTGTLPFASNLPGFEAFAWVNPFGGAVWVGQLATDGQFSNGGSITCGSPCGAEGGTYVYSYNFNAPLGGSLVLSGFTADNGVRSLTVNSAANGLLYSCSAGGPGTLCAATQTTITPSTGNLNFGSGLVSITATVEALDGPGRNPSGFILAGSATLIDPGTSEVPEPSTYAMVGLGGAAMLMARLRRR